MLEKIVLISVAYFCIATEMRFLAKQHVQDNKKAREEQIFKDSEPYHAKSIHIAG
jgi:hypothetical protein